MPNTYSQIYLHIVIVVSHRQNHINPSWEVALFKYIRGITEKCGQKLLAINGVPDHVHILLSVDPDCTPSYLMRDIKANSSRWVNENRLVTGQFRWQTGFGAFSVSRFGLSRVRHYIEGQKQHHAKTKFREEYIQLLQENDVAYDERYIFEDTGS